MTTNDREMDDIKPYLPLLREVVMIHSCNILGRYFGEEKKVVILKVPDNKKFVFHSGFQTLGYGELIQEKMLDNPDWPLFVSFYVENDELYISFGILEGPKPVIIFNLKGHTLEAEVEKIFAEFQSHEKVALARNGMKEGTLKLSFKEMVSIMSPTAHISFYLVFNQENLSDIYSL